MAAALIPMAVPAAMIASGSGDNKVVVTIDEKTFTPEVREVLRAAQHWAAVSENPADAKGWEEFEIRGGIRVSLERPSKEIKVDSMMASERRELLNKMCGNFKSDIAMLAITNSKQTGNAYAAAFTQRMKFSGTETVHFLVCRGRLPYSFDMAVEVDVGAFNGDNLQINEAIAKEGASKLVLALGLSNKPDAASSNATEPKTAISDTKTGAPEPKTKVTQPKPAAKGAKIDASKTPKSKTTTTSKTNTTETPTDKN